MLKDKLEEMKIAAAGSIPPEVMETMLRSREALTGSNILERIIKVGDKVSDFTLADANGKQVSLLELRQQGPVLINIYRGVW